MTTPYFPIIPRKGLPARFHKSPYDYSMSEMAEYVSAYALPDASPELRKRVMDAHEAHLAARKADATRTGVNKRNWAIVQQPLRYAMAKTKTSLDRFCQLYGPDCPEAEAYRAYWTFLTKLDGHIIALRTQDPALTPKEAIAQYNAHRPDDKPEITGWQCWVDWARMKPKAMQAIHDAFASLPYRPRARRLTPFSREGYMTPTLKLRLRYDPDAPAPNSKEAREATMRLVTKPEPATLEDVLTAIAPEKKPKPALEIPADVRAIWGEKPAARSVDIAKVKAGTGEDFCVPGFEDDADLRNKAQQTKEYGDDDK